jgi:hypothetical protein
MMRESYHGSGDFVCSTGDRLMLIIIGLVLVDDVMHWLRGCLDQSTVEQTRSPCAILSPGSPNRSQPISGRAGKSRMQGLSINATSNKVSTDRQSSELKSRQKSQPITG